MAFSSRCSRLKFLRANAFFPRQSYSTKPVISELPQPRLDYKAIAENITSKTTNALNRKVALPADAIATIARVHAEWKHIKTELNAKLNAQSLSGDEIRRCVQTGDKGGKETALIKATQLKAEVKELATALEASERQCFALALSVPNDTHPSTPIGPESAAVTLSTHGPKPLPRNAERDHVTISNKLALVDLASGATVTGTSWYFLKNEAALLELALTNYAMFIAIKHGFTPVTTPDVVRSDIAIRCGFQPRDDADPPVSHMYHIASTHLSSPELVLSGTSEIPLAGMFATQVLPVATLPRKVVGVGHAFRAEAGARSADTRGLYRVHQFTKVELFAVTKEDQSEAMMEEMKSIQISILEGLGLSFRVLDMPTEELGAGAFRKYDMEAWMPGRGSWGEVTSLSNCTDYQARRLHIRYRSEPDSKGETTVPFVHTLNGTAAAIPRLIVALIENGAMFDAKGEILGLRLPHVLKQFWVGDNSGRSTITWHPPP